MDKHITGNLGSNHSNVALKCKVVCQVIARHLLDPLIVFKQGIGEKEGTLICAQTEPNGMRSVHRAQFLEELVKTVPVKYVHVNKRLQDLEETEVDKVTLHFEDGTTVTADVAIGVDGIHSKVRQILMGVELATPVFSGAVVSRGTVPMNKGD